MTSIVDFIWPHELYRFPDPGKVPDLMADFVDWLNAGELLESKALESHLRLVTIHPFADGNGRTARLLKNILRQRLRKPAFKLPRTGWTEYCSAIRACQIRSNIQPFSDFADVTT